MWKLVDSPGSVAVAVTALGEEFDEQDTDYESADVGPEGYAAGLAGLGDRGSRTAEKLADSPVAEHEPCGDGKDENWREPDQDPRFRIEHEVGAHHAGDCAAGADAGHVRTGVEEDVGQTGGDSAQQIEDQVGEVSQVVFDVVAENPEHPHVAEHVKERSVQEHRG